MPHGYLSEGEGCEDEEEDVSRDDGIFPRVIFVLFLWATSENVDVLEPIIHDVLGSIVVL